MERKPGRPRGRTVKKFTTTFPPHTLTNLETLARRWNMSIAGVIDAVTRYVLYGEPLPKESEPGQADDEPPAVAA